MKHIALTLLCLLSALPTARAWGGGMSGLAIVRGGSTAAVAPVDCGDEVCTGGETCEGCPADCGECEPEPACPDDLCNGAETCVTCEADCGACSPDPECPDATCNGAETCATCEADCGACGSDPLDVYPDLDLSTIPWHVGAGGWGDQVVLSQVAEPVITEAPASVDTRVAFNSAASVQGTQITITGAGWVSSAASGTSISAPDVLVIVEDTVTIDGQIEINNVPRVRIRGETLGAYTGGLLGQIRSVGASVADLHIDGVGLNGAADYGTAAEENQALRLTATTRVAITNCRIISGAYTIVGDNTHLYFLGNSIYHGAASHDEVGQSEAWGIRNAGGPVTIFENDIRGTRYVQVRTHSLDSALGEVLYVGSNTLVALAEGRTAWFGPNLGNNTGIWDGAIFEDNQVYAYAMGNTPTSNCTFGPEMSTFQCAYSRGRRNDFFGMGVVTWSQTYLDELESGGASHTEYGPNADPPGDHDWSYAAPDPDANTFTNSVGAFPAWGGAGDPSALLPAGLTLVDGQCDGACDGSGAFDCPGLP